MCTVNHLTYPKWNYARQRSQTLSADPLAAFDINFSRFRASSSQFLHTYIYCIWFLLRNDLRCRDTILYMYVVYCTPLRTLREKSLDGTRRLDFDTSHRRRRNPLSFALSGHKFILFAHCKFRIQSERWLKPKSHAHSPTNIKKRNYKCVKNWNKLKQKRRK